jgi:alanyl-tRNA synthetase
MTERLYYTDSYLTEFDARIVETSDDGRRVYLDCTAFYPTSGGQPFDVGTLNGAAVVDVVDEGDQIAHVLNAPLSGAGPRPASGRIDWPRRQDHMQQHTGQHLLSAVFEELFHFPTLSFHLGQESSTIELGAASVTAAQLEKVELRCAEIVAESRQVLVTFEDEPAALRKESHRTGTLRIISIANLDRSACGGTHVRNTAEIGPVLTRKLDKVRGNIRVEFVCGYRALAQARADYRTLSAIGRTLSAPFDQAPGMIAAQSERIKTLEKLAQRQSTELATREGRDLYSQGQRRVTERREIDDATRAKAQAFVSGGEAVYLAISENPPSVLLAASPDSGIHAGDRVKAAVTAVGGRGGGNATLAQGSVPTAEALSAVAAALEALVAQASACEPTAPVQ